MSRPPLSVQLYSVREQFAADPAATAARLHSIGFRCVEPYGLTELIDAVEPALAGAGLSAPTAHVSLLDGNHEAAFAAAHRAGVSTIIEPFVAEEQWANRDAVEALAARLTAVADAAADHGLTVGYHNHWWELEARIDGTPALEVFADSLGDHVVLEVDTYWSTVGGVDPVELLGRLGDRVVALHIKDGPATREPLDQLPAGQGVVPIAAVLAAAPGARAVVEFDDYAGDIFEGLTMSFAFLQSIGIKA
ncbi:MAG: sugar phosphate isomerase/epimerase [Salinibacterium sp.]|nr:sugar phosphate isomerase/epimerase [Salinibacterium sp.]